MLEQLVLATALSWCPDVSPGDICHHLAVTCDAVKSSPAKVEVTTRNVSERGVEVRVKVEMSLVEVTDPDADARPLVLSTSFDPTTGDSAGLFETEPADIQLPAGSSYAVVLDLTRLLWSLSHRDVEAPRELWKLNVSGEYTVSVTIEAYPPTQDVYGSTGCERIHVHLPKE